METSVQLVLLLLCALAGPSLGRVSNCQTYCWTKWLDRDNPSGTGDYETLGNFNQNQVCPKPVGIECRTTAGAPYQSTGIYRHSILMSGNVCVTVIIHKVKYCTIAWSPHVTMQAAGE